MSCGIELILLCEIAFSVVFSPVRTVHEFDYRLVINS
jgi:hypothetical protein